MDRRALAIRFALGPAAIVAVFFFLEKTRPFAEVWKPLLLYYTVAIPAFLLIDKLKARSHADRPDPRPAGPGPDRDAGERATHGGQA